MSSKHIRDEIENPSYPQSVKWKTSDLEGLQAYHAGDTPAAPTDTESRLAALEADNAALKAAVARLQAIVDAIREYGEL